MNLSVSWNRVFMNACWQAASVAGPCGASGAVSAAGYRSPADPWAAHSASKRERKPLQMASMLASSQAGVATAGTWTSVRWRNLEDRDGLNVEGEPHVAGA